MDEVKLRKQVDFGTKADAALKNEAIQTAFSDLRAAIFDRMEACSIRDREDLQELKRLLTTLNNFKGYLEKAVKDGQFAASALKPNIGDRIAQRLRIA